jgi:transposase
VNVLKAHLRITIDTLLRSGSSQRDIERRTGVSRKTIRRYAVALAAANSPGVATGSTGVTDQTPPPRPPGIPVAPEIVATGLRVAPSACEPHRAWIETQVQLGRSAMSVYQDLVDDHAFTHRYNSVRRFVAALRARAPDRFDVLEFLPGEEAQVDYGLGALTRTSAGKYKRPLLFVMTLKYSGKSYRTTVWKTDQQVWARLHEQGFAAHGGCPQYVVLDNLKEGVVRPDLYAPELNPVYAAMLAHYGVVADPCRVQDPNRKGTVESAIQHTQGALKGRRFESLEAQNAWLAQWEERWAAPRIHGRKKRQVLELYREEMPHLRPLPLERFRCFQQESRTVDDSGLVQIGGSYYAALPAAPHSHVTVRLYATEIEIVDALGHTIRRHEKAIRKGSFQLDAGDRLFNPSRETARLLAKAALIGPATAALAQELFARLGRPGQRALYGLTQLTRTYPRVEVDAACARLHASGCYSYAAVKRALEHTRTTAEPPDQAPVDLRQADPLIRPIDEYQAFWDSHSTHSPHANPSPLDPTDAHVLA